MELYSELRSRARVIMGSERPDHTLQATALVNEIFLSIFRKGLEIPTDRQHMLALASKAMRAVLVDYARSRGRTRRTPPGKRLPIDAVLANEGIMSVYEDKAVDLVALDEALEKLAAFDPNMARAVELHFFGGLPIEETARALDLPLRTFERLWRATRAWLKAEIG